MITVFHKAGYVFCSKIALNRDRKYEREFGCRFLIMDACMLSCPGEAFFRLLMVRDSSSLVIGRL